MKKEILIDNQLLQMSFEEAYKQFERLKWKFFRHWRPKLPPKVENDDITQDIDIALWEAYEKYDASKGASFITYATLVINSMFWHKCIDLNRKKRQAYLTEESLNAKVKDTDLKTEIIDLIETKGFEDDLIIKIRIEESLNLLNDTDKTIINMITTGVTQAKIAKHLGKSQAEISRLSKKLRKTLRIELGDMCNGSNVDSL